MAKKPSFDLPKAAVADRIPWPQKPNELPERPRVWRIHRVDKFLWQAYVIGADGEAPVGKPDLYDIVIHKIGACMRHEGQRAFLDHIKANALKEAEAHRG